MAQSKRQSKESPVKSAATIALGKRVRSMRLAMGASQETLAELANLHWTFIGQVERGLRNVTFHNLIRLADALGTDPGELITGIGVDQLPEPRRRSSKADEIRRDRATTQDP